MIRSLLLTLIVLMLCNALFAQRPQRVFTLQDTLRGSITEEREWWDLAYYHLDIAVDPSDSTIEGSNTVGYRVLKENQVMQIDLQPPLELKKAVQDGKELKIRHDGNAHYVYLNSDQKVGKYYEVKLSYGGHPHIALRPPWSGAW